MYLPSNIQLISIPSVIFCTLFVWNAVVYLTFSRLLAANDRTRTLPAAAETRKKYLYFGLTSLCLAVYSFGQVYLYSSETLERALFWQRLQFLSAIPLFIFFTQFSAKYLGLVSRYWNRVVPIATLLFAPLVFWGQSFLYNIAAPKKVMIGNQYWGGFLEGRMAPLAYLFIAWCVPHLLYLGTLWVKRYRSRTERILLPVSFIIFTIAVVNDVLILAEVYSFFYMMELGFVAFIVAMSFQMFHDFLEVNQQFVRKTREVEILNEEMSFLVSTISHDFMAPLLSIGGFTKVLEEFNAEQNERFKHCLERINYNSDHMRELVQDLSTYVKIGRVVEELNDVDMERVLKDVLGMLEYPKRYGRAHLEIPTKWPALVSSEKRLRQIFFNLMENALKYSPSEEAYVGVHSEPRQGGVLFEVEDQGPGIPRHLCEKVFEPFFRDHPERPGTGLGLAIVKKSAERLGGKAWVDRNYHAGARFCIWLPSQM